MCVFVSLGDTTRADKVIMFIDKQSFVVELDSGSIFSFHHQSREELKQKVRCFSALFTNCDK